MAQTRLKSGNLHMVGGDNGSDGNVLKSKGDGTMEWGDVVINPTFSSFDYPGDDTALDPAGSQSLVINGGGFNANVTVTIGGTTCSSITRNSAEQLTVTTPAKSAGSQALVITNTDGGSASTNVSYNGIPAFTNAAGSLVSAKSGTTINVSAVATEPDGGAITYAITSGSLPSGISLNTSTGAITGTAPNVIASTTSNFTVTATDNENQSTARAYSITVTPPLPSDKFAVVTYTGNGGTQAITGVGFKPDFVWIKNRDTARGHNIFDSTRGINKVLFSNSTSAEGSESAGTSLSSFDTDGFTVGSGNGVNEDGDEMVAWCWKANGGTTSSNTDGTITSAVQANTSAGFSLVKFTGTGANGTVGHGLGVAPEIIIFKNYGGVAGWKMFTNQTPSPATQVMELQDTSGFQTPTNPFNSTLPTSTVFSVGTYSDINYSGGTFIAYCFTSVENFSKIGSYIGNGSTNGPIVETGFEPAYIMIKNSTSTYEWTVYDNKRSTSNPRDEVLYPNTSGAENSGETGDIDFLSNGFQLKSPTGTINQNGGTLIYVAFAADPDTTAPTLADSFGVKTYTGTGSAQTISGLGFSPNLVWLKHRNNATAHQHNLLDTVRTNGHTIHSNSNAGSEAGINMISSYTSDGFVLGTDNAVNQSGINHVAWAWKADDNEPTIEGGAARAVYKFEDNGNDVTGGLNLTASNMSYSSSGKFNKAAEFNGNNSNFTTTSISGLPTGSNPVSISYWMYTSTANHTAGLVGYGGNTNNKYFGTMLSGGDLFFAGYYYNSAFSPAVTVPLNQWNHLVWAFDGTNLRVYLNGSLAGTLNRSSLDIGGGGTLNLAIGKNSWSGTGSEHFNGKIDQVRIYSGKLEETQVAKLYTETTSDNDNLNFGGPPKILISVNNNAGFSIVKWTGDGVQGSTVPHGLSAAPDLIIMKDLSASNHWVVGNSESGWTKAMHLDLDNADNASNLYWDDTAPTSTVFSLGHHSTAYNVSGNEYIAYCWRSTSGYSKIGSYTGNGSSQTITTGFQPDFILIKKSSGTGTWRMFDSARGTDKSLRANDEAAEYDDTQDYITFISTGFSYTNQSNSDLNENSSTYIYLAIKIN